MFFESIIIGSVALLTLMFGDLPYRDPYAWISILVVIYHNQGRALARTLPVPRDSDSVWYRWFYDAAHELYRDNSKVIKKIGEGMEDE